MDAAGGMSRALLCPSPALQDGPQQLKVYPKLGSFFVPIPGDGAGGVQHEPSGGPKGHIGCTGGWKAERRGSLCLYVMCFKLQCKTTTKKLLISRIPRPAVLWFGVGWGVELGAVRGIERAVKHNPGIKGGN